VAVSSSRGRWQIAAGVRTWMRVVCTISARRGTSAAWWSAGLPTSGKHPMCAHMQRSMKIMATTATSDITRLWCGLPISPQQPRQPPFPPTGPPIHPPDNTSHIISLPSQATLLDCLQCHSHARHRAPM
jgi:hypothetical protein